MVSNYPSDAGYAWWLMEHFWKLLAERFAQNGKNAYLAFPKITSMSHTVAAAPLQPVTLSIPWHSRTEASSVKHFLRDKKISHLYLTDQPFFSSKYLALRLSGVHRIIIHDHAPGDRPPIGGVKGALKSARHAMPWFTPDKLLCVSELMRQRDIANGRIPAHKCEVVQNGIVPVDCTGHRASTLKRNLQLGPDTILVTTTGRMHPYKRFDFVIECANSLRDRAPDLDIVFLLVGDGPAMPTLQAMVHRLKLEKSVRLLGYRTDIRDLLCASDIALHAALGEGFSLSIVEYMSAGLPVLVPDIPSVCQAITHDETGIVYPKDNPGTVAAHIHALAIDTRRRQGMGGAAKAHADNTYSLERCTRSFLRAIEPVYFGNADLKV